MVSRNDNTTTGNAKDLTLAGLRRTLPITDLLEAISWRSTFNESFNDEMWTSIATSPGVVALDNDYVDSQQIRRGAEFPWDKSKSMYVLNSYHSLHCLVR